MSVATSTGGYAQWLYEQTCLGKRVYDTWKLASIAVIEMRKKYRGERFEAYCCRFCGELHIGHPGQEPKVEP